MISRNVMAKTATRLLPLKATKCTDLDFFNVGTISKQESREVIKNVASNANLFEIQRNDSPNAWRCAALLW
jgi:hypothetical protein